MSDIAVIGAGPAGLMAAEKMAAAGHRVFVFDRKPTVARKFLMAGCGGLNITHSEPLPVFLSRYRGAECRLSEALHRFSPSDLRAWCDGLGEPTFVGSSGRVFPVSMKASPLLRAWIKRLQGLGVLFFPLHTWQGWNDQGALVFSTPQGLVERKVDALLLALGGASWPRLGADGSWAKFLQDRGVDVRRFRPSNCGFYVNWSLVFKEKCARQPLKGVRVFCGEASAQGDAMITPEGIEGGVIYALSSVIREALEKQAPHTLRVDLKPDVDLAVLEARLRERGSQSLSSFLQKRLHLSSVAAHLMREGGGVNSLMPHELALRIKACPLVVESPFSLERAISSAGGIAFDEVSESFMLKKLPGVFVAGEMLDWEAPTGGYLLQACFSMGVSASLGLMTWLDKKL